MPNKLWDYVKSIFTTPSPYGPPRSATKNHSKKSSKARRDTSDKSRKTNRKVGRK